MIPARFTGVVVQAPSGCWIWLAARDRGGYGRHGGRSDRAHRTFYEELVGPIPRELDIDHLCRQRRCVNPLHMQPVTRMINVLRGESFAAVNARKTRCIHGHDFTTTNTYIRPNGRRDCRACIRARAAAYVARKKVA